MDKATADWIKDAEANIKKHERDIVAAIDRRDFSTAKRLQGWADKLHGRVQELKADMAEKNPSIDDLNAGQRAALMTFRAQNGRSWKQKLLDGWQRAAYPGALQQIRNQFGPEWLTKLRHVPDYRLDVSVKTADGCVGTYSVSLGNRGQPKDGPITWFPREPDAETDSVTIKCYDGDELKQEYVTDGDLWRALEDGDLHEELWDNVLKGLPLAEAIEAMPVVDSNCRI